MKSPKDGYYTVYLLPREWYVGQTGNIKQRLATHKDSLKRDITDWTLLAEVMTKREAINIETHYHNRGYKGKRELNLDYKSFQSQRLSNIDYKSRTANTDWEKKSMNSMKPINQLGIDGKFIAEWSSGKEIHNSLGILAGDISACVKGRQNTAGGYKWEYKKI